MKKEILLEDRPPRSDRDSQMRVALVITVTASVIGAALFYMARQVT